MPQSNLLISFSHILSIAFYSISWISPTSKILFSIIFYNLQYEEYRYVENVFFKICNHLISSLSLSLSPSLPLSLCLSLYLYLYLSHTYTLHPISQHSSHLCCESPLKERVATINEQKNTDTWVRYCIMHRKSWRKKAAVALGYIKHHSVTSKDVEWKNDQFTKPSINYDEWLLR